MHISTEYYTRKLDKDGKATGLCAFHSMKPIAVVMGQLESVLKAYMYDDDGANAFNIAHWVKLDSDIEIAPKGVPIAMMNHGSCEGYLVRIVVHDRINGVFLPLVTIKYLTDKDFVYKVARKVNEALNEGLYQLDEPFNDILSQPAT